MINARFVPGKTPQDAITWINKQEKSIILNVQSAITQRARQLTKNLQSQLNDDVAGGPVPFTKRALFFNFIQNGDKRTNQIIIRGDQAAYLRTVISDVDEVFDKFVPVSNAKLTKQGNIQGLRAGLNKKYKVMERNGKKYLIDTTKKRKNRDKRIVAVHEMKKRKMVFDFFKNAEDGAKLILRDVNGTFTFTKRIT
jgi:hypothetical protein